MRPSADDLPALSIHLALAHLRDRRGVSAELAAGKAEPRKVCRSPLGAFHKTVRRELGRQLRQQGARLDFEIYG